MNNIFVLDKNFNKIGTLSNQGANPPAPYFNDLYIQELDTGADTFQFSTISNKYTQDLLEVGNHIMFAYKNRHELFTITSLEYSHSEGYMTIGVYAEGLGFELLDIYMEKPKKTESGGGNDSDGDGDDNTDDEYADPDDIYIDEDGNIIYDKDGSGPPSADDVTIDGDGNIIYQPGKNKNKNNDHLEFKNISYPTFLNIMLKNTGWNYICQPGLKSNKQDMRVSYDKNIYAILQDSMQTYKGVELEFVYEYNNGSIIKTVKAYNDGGRGSFVGKRFKYGQNVRGITKTQEVCTEKEDAIIFVDDVGVEIYYDIDFALKSAEVPEIEIGDTHYVIDSDFCPPMQIKARIGKIEISFSDLTRNKIYLANNKKIRGSEDDDFDEDDIKDIIDDYEPEIDDPDVPMVPVAGSDDLIKAPRMHAYEFLLYTNKDGSPNYSTHSRTTDYSVIDSPSNDGSHPTSEDIYEFLINGTKVYDVSYKVLDYLRGTGNYPSNYCLRITPDVNTDYALCKDHSATDYTDACTMSLAGSRIFSDIINSTDRPDFPDGTNGDGKLSNDHHDKHLLDVGSLACGLLSAFQYHIKKGHNGGSSGEDGASVFDKLHVNKTITMGSSSPSSGIVNISLQDSMGETRISATGVTTTGGVTANGIRAKGGSFSENVDFQRVRVYGSGVTGGIHIFEQISLPNGDVITPSSPSIFSGGSNSGPGTNCVSVAYLDNRLLDYATIDYVDSKLGGSGGSGGSNPGSGSGNLDGLIDAVEVDNDYTDTGKDIDLHVRKPTYFDGPIYMTGEWNSWGGASNHFTSIYGVGQLETMIINCDCWRPNDIYKDVTFYGDVIVDGTLTYKDIKPSSDISKKENIRYINNQAVQKENLETRNYSNEDLLEKADLHDFIVNQVNICEYNFIGDTANKIGFIANDYEGTKVGDKIVSKQEFKERNDDGEIIEISESLVYDVDNLLFATIGALQEEVRIKDEKIASLEDRLARLEAMLGIDN